MNIPLLAGSVFAIFGLYLLRHAITRYKTAKASHDWPIINGQLTDVRLWGKRNISGEMKDANHLIVEYNYEINGLKYTSKSATFYTLAYPKTIEFAEHYSSTNNVKVYYNPEDFSESVLEPGPNPDKPYSDLILSTAAIAIGIVIATLAWFGIIG